MLSKNDKKWIREMMQGELKDWIDSFLAYTVTVEKGSEGPGDIPGNIEEMQGKRGEADRVFVFDMLMIYLPKIAAAMRASQADAVAAKNKAIDASKGIEGVGQTLIGMEDSFERVAKFAAYLKKTGLLEQLEEAVGMIEQTKAIDAPVQEIQQ